MNIKPAGKVAIVILIIGGAYFLIRPLVGKKKDVIGTEVIRDSTIGVRVESLQVVPTSLRHAPAIQPVTIQKKQVIPKPVTVKPEPVKPVAKPKKKGERENLDINF